MQSASNSDRSFLDRLAANLARLPDSSSYSRTATPDPASLTEAPHPLRRSPLAPIDQRALASTPDHMSSPSSPHPSSALNQDPNANINPQRFIGKPILSRRSSHSTEEAYVPGGTPCQGPRKKSQSHMVIPARTLPYPPTKPARRPLHAYSHSTSSSISSRRTSLPSLHFHPPLSHALPTSSAIMQQNEENINADDFHQTYSALSTYTFGAASASTRLTRDADMLSPLASTPGNDYGDPSEVFSDRTPRPSISHPRNEEEDDEETARRDRAKMRAIDDGGRRPSLPSNVSAVHASLSGLLIGSPRSSTEQRDSAFPDDDGDYSARSSTPEGGHGSGALDTDVELEDVAPDNASQNTFGMDSGRPRGSRPYTQPWDLSDSESENDRQWELYVPGVASNSPGLSPVVFSRMRNSDEESSSISSGYAQSSAAVGRRGSLPVAIPGRAPPVDAFGAAPVSRDREDSIVTVRRPSRSLDDDLRAINPTLGGIGASEPTTRADWQALEEDHPARLAAEIASSSNPLDGIDMDYILGGSSSRRSSNSFMHSLPAPPAKGKGKERDKGKGKGKAKEISLRNNMAEFFGSRGEGTSSLAGPASAMAEIAPWSLQEPISGRRPSTATIGEDTFAGHVRSADPQGIEGLSEWFFRLEESRDPQARRQNKLLSIENWYCDQIGKILTQRLVHQGSGPDQKPHQQRLRVIHEVDSRCKGNPLGGPGSVVHKHSRTVAFSIFRRYNIPSFLPSQSLSPRSGDTGTGQSSSSIMEAIDCIMLASKSVQAEYTNTQSTKLLSTHGLLEDRDQHSRNRGAGRDRSRDRGSISRGTTSERRPNAPAVPPVPEVPRLDQRIVDQNALAQTLRPSTAGSTTDSQAATSSTQSSLDLSRSTESATSHGSTAGRRLPAPAHTGHDSSDSDTEEFLRQPTRTSHAEAFATLDPVTLEQIRANPTSPPSVSGWFRRRRNPNVPRATQNNITPMTPPWMQLTSRAHQDKNNRTLADLNQSFQEVGLLPAYRKRGSSGIGRTGKTTGSSLTNHIPEDSVFMLLPLWPYETDAQSTAMEPWSPHTYEPELQSRLYLLVYYVGMSKKDKEAGSSESGSSKKRRSRSVSGRGEPSGSSGHARSIYLPNHHATARLVSYSDLNGSGVRLPTRGLSVTGSMTQAIAGIPPASLRDVHRDDFVVAFQQKRERGVQIIPEGLEKLGLCQPRSPDAMRPQAAPGMQVSEFPEDIEPQPLTAIGRAAVELIWLGCMAVTKFEGH